jgi:hypothetical protein
MTTDLLRTLLGWGAIFNLAFLSLWFLLFISMRDSMLRLHGRWFRITIGAFDAIHYAGMAWYKLATWMFFIFPYIALRLGS